MVGELQLSWQHYACVTPVTGAAAPKFIKWNFTTCLGANTGAVRTGLIFGRAHLCDRAHLCALVIETITNGAQPISADFRYELKYREGNQPGKLMLDSVDYWKRDASQVPPEWPQFDLHCALERSSVAKLGVHQHQCDG